MCVCVCAYIMRACQCVRACVFACAHACVRSSVRACVRSCVRAYASMRVRSCVQECKTADTLLKIIIVIAARAESRRQPFRPRSQECDENARRGEERRRIVIFSHQRREGRPDIFQVSNYNETALTEGGLGVSFANLSFHAHHSLPSLSVPPAAHCNFS